MATSLASSGTKRKPDALNFASCRDWRDLQKQVEEILELAHQVRGHGFNYMTRDDIEELVKSQENGLTE